MYEQDSESDEEELEPNPKLEQGKQKNYSNDLAFIANALCDPNIGSSCCFLMSGLLKMKSLFGPLTFFHPKICFKFNIKSNRFHWFLFYSECHKPVVPNRGALGLIKTKTLLRATKDLQVAGPPGVSRIN